MKILFEVLGSDYWGIEEQKTFGHLVVYDFSQCQSVAIFLDKEGRVSEMKKYHCSEFIQSTKLGKNLVKCNMGHIQAMYAEGTDSFINLHKDLNVLLSMYGQFNLEQDKDVILKLVDKEFGFRKWEPNQGYYNTRGDK